MANYDRYRGACKAARHQPNPAPAHDAATDSELLSSMLGDHQRDQMRSGPHIPSRRFGARFDCLLGASRRSQGPFQVEYVVGETSDRSNGPPGTSESRFPDPSSQGVSRSLIVSSYHIIPSCITHTHTIAHSRRRKPWRRPRRRRPTRRWSRIWARRLTMTTRVRLRVCMYVQIYVCDSAVRCVHALGLRRQTHKQLPHIHTHTPNHTIPPPQASWRCRTPSAWPAGSRGSRG